MPSIRNKNVRGDHYVTLVVQVPESLTEKQKQALRAYQEAMGETSTEKKGFFGKHKK